MQRKLIVMSMVLMSSMAALSAFGQGAAAPAMSAANSLLHDGKFAEAVTAFEAIVKAEPTNGGAWYQLAAARYSLKQYTPAAEAFQRNVDLTNNGFAMYNLACVYSLLGDKDKAVEWLTKTVDNPKMVLPAVNFDDPDLSNIKEDARFKVLTEKVGRQIHPCLYSDAAKEFNFWIGEWDVYNPQGRHDGTSSIQSIANGCGLLENWTDSFANTGKSINFYDSGDGKWYQYWIGSGGGPLRYSGVYKDGAIRYESESVDKAGKKTLSRLTFFNVDANTVRQLAESSTDEGKTWTTGYDYKYIRKK